MAQRVLCVGEMVADLIAYPIEGVELNTDYHKMERFSVLPGGDAHNNAVNMARLGNQVTYIGRVGRDVFGNVCVDSLKAEQVDTSHIVYSETAEQSICLILLGKNKQRTLYQMFKVSEEFCFEDVDLSVLDQADVLQIGGTFHMGSFDGEGAAKLLKLAKEKGIRTSMDVSMDRRGRWGDLIEVCYPYLDYFMPSVEQAVELTHKGTWQEMAEYLLGKGVKNVVIKAGDKGSYFLNESEEIFCGCYHIPVEDSTGAGDAFVSGFLTALGKGFSHEECMLFATACSAQVIQKVGATTGMENFREIVRFMEENERVEIYRKERH